MLPVFPLRMNLRHAGGHGHRLQINSGVPANGAGSRGPLCCSGQPFKECGGQTFVLTQKAFL